MLPDSLPLLADILSQIEGITDAVAVLKTRPSCLTNETAAECLTRAAEKLALAEETVVRMVASEITQLANQS